MFRPFVFTAVLAASIHHTGFAQAPSAPTRVVLSGMAAPGGGTYGSFSTPVLNQQGEIAFRSVISGSSATNGVFAGSASSLQAIALQGTAAPVGGNYNSLSTTVQFNNAGQVAFSSTLSGGSSTFGSFVSTNGTLQGYALQGTAAPAGGNFNAIGTSTINAGGQVLTSNTLTGGSSAGGLFAGSPNSLQTVALRGTAAPEGGTINTFTVSARINSAGQVAYAASLTGGTASRGIFVGTPGAMQTVALTGTPAPGGNNFSDFPSGIQTLSDSGQVIFTALLSNNRGGVFVGSSGSVQAIALDGTPSPISGLNHEGVGTGRMNASGLTYYESILSDNSTASFLGSVGVYQTLAHSGTNAPGGAQFAAGSPGAVSLNDQGQFAFLRSLTGTGITTANDRALFAGTSSEYYRIVGEGDLVDADPSAGTDFRTVANNGISISGSTHSQALGLNDSGLLVYGLTFTDGSSGIFVTQLAPVPEPGCVLLACGTVVAIGRWWRRATKA